MREVREVRKNLEGKDAWRYVAIARTFLGQLKTQLAPGLGFALWRRRLADGTLIEVSSIHGQDRIRIFTQAQAACRPQLPPELFGFLSLPRTALLPDGLGDYPEIIFRPRDDEDYDLYVRDGEHQPPNAIKPVFQYSAWDNGCDPTPEPWYTHRLQYGNVDWQGDAGIVSWYGSSTRYWNTLVEQLRPWVFYKTRQILSAEILAQVQGGGVVGAALRTVDDVTWLYWIMADVPPEPLYAENEYVYRAVLNGTALDPDSVEHLGTRLKPATEDGIHHPIFFNARGDEAQCVRIDEFTNGAFRLKLTFGEDGDEATWTVVSETSTTRRLDCDRTTVSTTIVPTPTPDGQTIPILMDAQEDIVQTFYHSGLRAVFAVDYKGNDEVVAYIGGSSTYQLFEDHVTTSRTNNDPNGWYVPFAAGWGLSEHATPGGSYSTAWTSRVEGTRREYIFVGVSIAWGEVVVPLDGTIERDQTWDYVFTATVDATITAGNDTPIFQGTYSVSSSEQYNGTSTGSGASVETRVLHIDLRNDTRAVVETREDDAYSATTNSLFTTELSDEPWSDASPGGIGLVPVTWNSFSAGSISMLVWSRDRRSFITDIAGQRFESPQFELSETTPVPGTLPPGYALNPAAVVNVGAPNTDQNVDTCEETLNEFPPAFAANPFTSTFENLIFNEEFVNPGKWSWVWAEDANNVFHYGGWKSGYERAFFSQPWDGDNQTYFTWLQTGDAEAQTGLNTDDPRFYPLGVF